MTFEQLLRDLDSIVAFSDGIAASRARALRTRLRAEGLQLIGESPGETVLRSIKQLRELEAEIVASSDHTIH